MEPTEEQVEALASVLWDASQEKTPERLAEEWSPVWVERQWAVYRRMAQVAWTYVTGQDDAR